MKVKYNNEVLNVKFNRYANNNNLAIQLFTEDEESYIVATTNVRVLGSHVAAIKDYSENVGMEKALIEAGVIESKPLSSTESGFVMINNYALTDEASDLLEKQLGEEN